MSKKKTKKGPKANGGMMGARTLEVLEWLQIPLCRHEILVRAKKAWKLKPRQIDNYLAAAKVLLRESFLQEVDENRAIIQKKLWGVYEKAMEGHPRFSKLGDHIGDDPDFNAANTSLKTLAQLHGLLINKLEIPLDGDPDLEDVPTEVLIKYAKTGPSHNPDDNSQE